MKDEPPSRKYTTDTEAEKETGTTNKHSGLKETSVYDIEVVENVLAVVQNKPLHYRRKISTLGNGILTVSV